MKEVLRQHWNYVLYETDDKKYLLSVVCGTHGLYDVNVKLTSEQSSEYSKRGKEFIQELAAEIRWSPSKYTSLRIDT